MSDLIRKQVDEILSISISPSADAEPTQAEKCEDCIHNGTNKDKITCKECASIEAVHGKWIKATGMMPPEFHGHHCCSECGNFANMEPPFGNREDLSNFCPNCGAMMIREDGEA